MSDVELDNKIRLNQARRDAVREKLSMSDSHGSKKNLYGGKKEKEGAKKYANKLKKIASPIAAAKAAKDIVTAPMEFRVMDVPIYGMAAALALFKDLLDLAMVGSLPGIGTVITWCISISIGLVLMFDGITSTKRRIARNLTKKLLILIAGTIVEGFLFGLNFLPFELLTVGIIYWMTLVDRKKEKRLKKEEQEENY